MTGKMKKTGGAFLSMLHLDRRTKTPLTRQLENKIRKAILNGSLPQETRLPSTRQLAQDLGVSRLTIKNAFEQLVTEGFLESHTGSGTYVANLSPGDLPIEVSPSRRLHPSLNLGPVSPHIEQILGSRSTTRLDQVSAFRPGIPALDLFPRRAWAEAQSRATRNQDSALLGYGPPGGLEELKRAIAGHVRDSRGIECDADQIVVTAGAQQAFSIVLMTLLTRGNTIWMEDPGHIAFRDTARLQGLNVRSVPLDSEGFSIAYAVANHDPCNLIFVTPSHQHPLGMTMSLPRRMELLELARDQKAWIVEDDYDSEFHYEERPQPALKALDPNAGILYVGSFSKTMFPAIRLGYLICPPGFSGAFATAGTLLSQNVSLLQQKAMALFMQDGSYNAHIRKMKQAYRQRRDLLVTTLTDHAADILESAPCKAGIHLFARFNDTTISDREMAKRLWDAGIDCLPVSIFRDQAPVAPGLLLGFACAPEQQIVEKTMQAVVCLKRGVQLT